MPESARGSGWEMQNLVGQKKESGTGHGVEVIE